MPVPHTFATTASRRRLWERTCTMARWQDGNSGLGHHLIYQRTGCSSVSLPGHRYAAIEGVQGGGLPRYYRETPRPQPLLATTFFFFFFSSAVLSRGKWRASRMAGKDGAIPRPPGRCGTRPPPGHPRPAGRPTDFACDRLVCSSRGSLPPMEIGWDRGPRREG